MPDATNVAGTLDRSEAGFTIVPVSCTGAVTIISATSSVGTTSVPLNCRLTKGQLNGRPKKQDPPYAWPNNVPAASVPNPLSNGTTAPGAPPKPLIVTVSFDPPRLNPS